MDYAISNVNTEQPLDMDYDDLWNGRGHDLVRWDRTRYATLADFTAGTGLEAHGLAIDPGFVDAANSDYTLSPSSGLIDRGVLIPGIDDGYRGVAPDIGAFEYASAPPTRKIHYLPLLLKQSP
jgi:hypothetical protein